MPGYLPLLQGGEAGEHLVPRTFRSCSREGMHHHEYKSRQVVVLKGDRQVIEILHMYCGSTHTLLPRFVLPYHTTELRPSWGLW